MDETKISEDDLSALRFMLEEFEKAQHTVRTFQAYLGRKYNLANGDQIDVAGEGRIIKAAPNVT